MITRGRFLQLVAGLPAINRNLEDQANEAQLQAVLHDDDRILQIVAGPGSGKTTVLVLRGLRATFVDGVLPENILITTFTRKAAKELRTRWLDWGTALKAALEADPAVDRAWLDSIDLNRCRIDTLDSIAQQTLTDFRVPGTIPPVVAEGNASNLILKRMAFQKAYFANKDMLDDLFARYSFDQEPPRNQGDALRTAKRLLERLIQDRVNLQTYARAGKAQAAMVAMLQTYKLNAQASNVYDFPLMEEMFLERLVAGSLAEWLGELQVVLIDEYQDTNPLQEAIYFEIARRAETSVTIVGDDDQAMYRFRGGSVELFTSFAARCQAATGRATRRVDMVRNFRSLPEIVTFYNNHVVGDSAFHAARITPAKPQVIPSRTSRDIPVLGMFRDTPDALARDLARFLHDLRTNRRVGLPNGQELTLHAQGDMGDAVLLSHSVEEIKYDRFNGGSLKERFPHLLRAELNTHGLEVFNPRGQALRIIPDVGVLLGLVLLALDPDGALVPSLKPTREAEHFLGMWRQRAESFIATNPQPNRGAGLRGFIGSWQRASRGEIQQAFARDWPALELVFKFMAWMPAFQSDPEHQVWLEAITRIISNTGVASPYGMLLLQNYLHRGERRRQVRTRGETQVDDVIESRRSFIRDALLAIAENEVDVDEDIMESVPRTRLQLMTIHQAKGLEFPLVMVDVASMFKMNAPAQRGLRFPDGPSNVVIAEQDVEPHLPGRLRGGRRPLDRTFDDLVRLYYVAFSRPQSVLMLVGCQKCLSYGKGKDLGSGIIPHVGLGWKRDGDWPWRQGFQGRRPPVLVEPPFLQV